MFAEWSRGVVGVHKRSAQNAVGPWRTTCHVSFSSMSYWRPGWL